MIDFFKDIGNHLAGRPYVGAGEVREVREVEPSNDYQPSAPTSDRDQQQASRNVTHYRGVAIRDMGGGDVRAAKQAVDDLKATGYAGGLRKVDIAKNPRHRDGTVPQGWCNAEEGRITLATNGHDREQLGRNAAHEVAHFKTSSEDEAEAAEYGFLGALSRLTGGR
jgi:hypothetical protein